MAGSSNQTTQRIAAASKEEAQQLFADVENVVSVLGLQLADHGGKEQIVRAAQQALLEMKQIRGRYKSPYEPESVELHLNPIRLCLIKNAWYLISQPENEAEPRTYRIARFESADVLEAPATIPKEFDIRAYFGNAWAVFRGDKSFDVRIRFSPAAAKIITETQWHHTQEANWRDDGSVELSSLADDAHTAHRNSGRPELFAGSNRSASDRKSHL